MVTVLAQPETGSPNSNFRIIIKMIAKSDSTELRVPIQVAIANGISEKLMKPSREYFKRLKKLHEVLTRNSFSILITDISDIIPNPGKNPF